MSVPEGKRGQGKLQVLVDANALAEYTIRICKNPKIFLPEYQDAMTNDLIHDGKEIFIHAWAANSIRVSSDRDAEQRKELQNQAIMDCDRLLAGIEIAHKLFHLSGKRVRYWSKMALDVKAELRKWRNSDAKRYLG